MIWRLQMNIGEAFQTARNYHAIGNLEQAEHIYRDILRDYPMNAGAYYELGNVLQDKGLLDEAIRYYQESINLDPFFAGAYNNLGNVFRKKGQVNESIVCFLKGIQLAPDFFGSYYNLGEVLQEQGRLDEVIVYYRKALQLNANHVATIINLGNALRDKGQIEAAIALYEKAILINPGLPDAHLNLSLAMLLMGNFGRGWKEYEWRWKVRDPISGHRDFPQPRWDGSDIKGRSILLHAEQGFGDTIQFIRYVPLVAERGAEVILQCPGELKALMESVEGTRRVIACNEEPLDFDLHCPLLSLPLIFDTRLETIPARVPYIRVSTPLKKRWFNKIRSNTSRLKVGLVWASSGLTELARSKSLPLEMFLPLSQFDNVILYSLQKGEAAKHAQVPPRGMKLIDYTEDISDFADTAAFIENLDLVVSVDTAVAHLAGALGKPVWTLLPFVPAWRWLLNREDCPWYPTMKLFRQPSTGDWESVIVNIGNQLAKLLKLTDRRAGTA